MEQRIYQITVRQSWAEASFLKTGRWQTAREQAREDSWGSLPLMRHNNIQIPDRLLFKLLRTLKKGKFFQSRSEACAL